MIRYIVEEFGSSDVGYIYFILLISFTSDNESYDIASLQCKNKSSFLFLKTSVTVAILSLHLPTNW